MISAYLGLSSSQGPGLVSKILVSTQGRATITKMTVSENARLAFRATPSIFWDKCAESKSTVFVVPESTACSIAWMGPLTRPA
jgi:hypothetical protein